MNSLKKHSFLFPFCLLKNWGDCLSCGGGGGGNVYVPIKHYSLFSFFFIQNFKRWQGGWIWSYFFRVIFFLCGGGPESRAQSPESSARSSPGLGYSLKMTWQVDKATRQNKTTQQEDKTTWQGDKTSFDICSDIFKLILMILIYKNTQQSMMSRKL